MAIFLGLVCFFLSVAMLISLIATVVYIGLGIWNQDSKKGETGIKWLVLTIVLFMIFRYLIFDTLLAFFQL